MKNRGLIFLSLFFLSCLIAQKPYQPMVVEGATWIDEHSRDLQGTSMVMYQVAEGDTISNNKTFKKLLSHKIENIGGRYVVTLGPMLYGLIREDTTLRKVYFKHTTIFRSNCQPDSAFLLYDFSLQEGELVDGCKMVPWLKNDTVASIFQRAKADLPGKINLDGVAIDSLKAIVTEGLPGWRRQRFIESIGLESGLFGNAFPATSNQDLYNLIYYCRGNACDSLIDFTTNLDKEEEILGVSVFPNPVSKKEYINLNNIDEEKIANIQLIDMHGKIIKTLYSLNSKIELPNELPPGIYGIRLITTRGLITTNKIMVE